MDAFKKKILHLCLCGLFGEKYAYQDNLLTKYHKKLGYDVTIIAPTKAQFTSNGNVIHEPAGTTILANGCKLIRVRTKYKSEWINKYLNLYEDITDIILDETPELIFVHNLSSFNYLCLLKIKKAIPEVKIVFDNHMDEYNSNKNFLSIFLNGFVYRNCVVKRLLPIASRFYGVTPSRCIFLKDILGVPEKNIYYLPMGADDEKMQFDDRMRLRENVRRQYNVSDEDFLIVTGGKIDKSKHIDLLAKAVSDLDSQHVKILMFGSITDNLKPIIENLLSDRVIYAGWINSDDVYQYFYASDLVIFPGLHSVMWEQAVASRCPIAVSKLRGFEHVDFNYNCLFLDDCSIEYYKSFVNGIYSDKHRYAMLKQNADSEKATQFLYSKIAQKVIDDIQ